MLYRLKKRNAPTKVEKICSLCGWKKQVMSGQLICPHCHKKALKTIYGEIPSNAYILDNEIRKNLHDLK